MKEYVIYPLVVGANEIDQGIMTWQKGYGKRIWNPMYAFYIEGAKEKILVDTGLEEFVLPPEAGEKLGVDILPFEAALATVNLKPEDIDIIIHTHLHFDHCGNDYKCPNARVYVQQAELAFMQNPHPIDYRYFPDLMEEVNVVPLEGDQEILDGISVLFTPGHTPGSQSVVINTAGGRAVITGFCCNQENFLKNGGVVTPGVHINAIEAYDNALRVRKAADILIPIHDPSIGRRKRIP